LERWWDKKYPFQLEWVFLDISYDFLAMMSINQFMVVSPEILLWVSWSSRISSISKSSNNSCKK